MQNMTTLFEGEMKPGQKAKAGDDLEAKKWLNFMEGDILSRKQSY